MLVYFLNRPEKKIDLHKVNDMLTGNSTKLRYLFATCFQLYFSFLEWKKTPKSEL